MDLRTAIEHLREDLQRFAEHPKATPGAVAFKQTVLNTLIEEFNRNEARELELEAQLTVEVEVARRAEENLDKQVLWCRLYGIPDGVRDISRCVPGSTRYENISDLQVMLAEDKDPHEFPRMVEYAGGFTLERLKAAIDIRIAQFAVQGPARPNHWQLPGGRVLVVPPSAPWLDGDWDARDNAAHTALDAAFCDELLKKHFS